MSYLDIGHFIRAGGARLTSIFPPNQIFKLESEGGAKICFYREFDEHDSLPRLFLTS